MMWLSLLVLLVSGRLRMPTPEESDRQEAYRTQLIRERMAQNGWWRL